MAEGDSLNFNVKCKGLTNGGNTKEMNKMQWGDPWMWDLGVWSQNRKWRKCDDGINTKQKIVLCALRRSGNAMGKMRSAESAMAASATGNSIENICNVIRSHRKYLRWINRIHIMKLWYAISVMGRKCDDAIGRSHRKYLRHDQIASQIFAMDLTNTTRKNAICDLRWVL